MKSELKMRRRNIALSVSYDGTNYNGFQRQNPPNIAIQNILEERLAKIFGEKIEMIGSGRTDAGVHAIGQVVNFFTDGRIETEKIPYAASGALPPDIVVRAAWEADRNFSALHSAKSKIYIYKIQRGKILNPFLKNFSWHIRFDLDVELMQAALNMIVGTFDFSAFKAASSTNMNPIRTIYAAEIFSESDEILTIKIHASGFLYHMARNIVAAVVEVGRHRLTLENFKKIFESGERKLFPATAPACGLYLYKVFYE
jgi:tRNA pseudouridine38-40 synthase